MVKKLSTLVLITLIALASIFSGSQPVAAASEGDPCGDITTVRLMAGQNIEAGSVQVWNDASNLYVKFATAGDWYLQETHLAVALSLSGIPMRNGNPVPGRFPYKMVHNPPATEYTYVLPLSGYTAGTRLVVAAHASVIRMEGSQIVQQETGWGEGSAFPGNNWAMYFYFTVQECQQDNGGGCTLTQGYWKTHSQYGPAPYDPTWAQAGEDTPFFSSGKTWYQMLGLPTRGDAYTILARQYIAAILNQYNGASAPAEVSRAIAQASQWLSSHQPPVRTSSLDGRIAVQLSMTLDQYNNGLIGPGHCGDTPPVEPPPPSR